MVVYSRSRFSAPHKREAHNDASRRAYFLNDVKMNFMDHARVSLITSPHCAYAPYFSGAVFSFTDWLALAI